MLAQGLKLGVLGWLIGQAPLWLLWYAEQPWPWPGTLVLKQLPLELASSLIVGATIVAVSRKRQLKMKPNLSFARAGWGHLRTDRGRAAPSR